MNQENSFRIRAGALALLTSGVLTVIGLYFRGPIIDQSLQTEAFVKAASSPYHTIAWCILLPNLVIQLYGFLGLYAFLAPTSANRLAFAGAVLSIGANGFFLPFTGVIAFVSPAVAKLYLQGQTEVVDVITAGLAGGFAFPFMMGSALLLLLGSIFFAVAIWRSGRLPKWPALLYAIHSIFIGFVAPLSYVLEFTGGLLLLASTAGIARAIWRQT